MGKGAEDIAYVLCFTLLPGWVGGSSELLHLFHVNSSLTHAQRYLSQVGNYRCFYFKGLGNQGSSLIDVSIINGDLLLGPF